MSRCLSQIVRKLSELNLVFAEIELQRLNGGQDVMESRSESEKKTLLALWADLIRRVTQKCDYYWSPN